uniref:Uncharacterized protein n=1 Tax=Arundo donax TaxID=35708 RepID=A0A0A8YU54_ARUDO
MFVQVNRHLQIEAPGIYQVLNLQFFLLNLSLQYCNSK